MTAEAFSQSFSLLLIGETNIFKKKVEAWIEKLMGCELLPETEIISLCKKAKEVFNQVAIMFKTQIGGYRHHINMVVKLTISSFVNN